MEKWTEFFDSPAERRRYIKAQRKKANTEGKHFRVLKRSYCRQRCTRKIIYFAVFARE